MYKPDRILSQISYEIMLLEANNSSLESLYNTIKENYDNLINLKDYQTKILVDILLELIVAAMDKKINDVDLLIKSLADGVNALLLYHYKNEKNLENVININHIVNYLFNLLPNDAKKIFVLNNC
ncbi:MAG: hypothetical protein OEV44_00920 [Spirochaetota bacterium]|nr:hypothetical protein [Spirochaetota bacterium]